MTEQLISFKTAMIAKKVGFNWILGFCATQSLLQKYLREEHNLHISIDCNASGWYWNISKTNGTNVLDYKYIDTETGYHDTFEDALETGLQEELKLI